MRRTVTLSKRVGETPLQALEAWKKKHPAYADVPASYAGRLDPMASGKLLVLLGDECKRQTEYTALDKEYEIEVLLDVGSDTGDILGLVDAASTETVVSKAALQNVLQKELGTHVRTYPIYSSKTVSGKPLFLYALENSLDTIHIPTHEETIYGIHLLKITTLSTSELKERVLSLLALAPTSNEPSKLLGADFRITPVRASWEPLLHQYPERSYTVLRLRVRCASGSYMRSLTGRIGESLATKALALSIHRTKIGSSLWNRILGNTLRK